jgi:hypothetical protein
MIYPSTLNLTVLQDSTFEQDLIITEAAKAATLNDATNVITSPCHGFVANDRIAVGVEDGDLPCGFVAGEAYFVLASGLTSGAFKLSASAGGPEIDFTVLTSTATYFVGKVIDLTNYTFDSDIRTDYGEALTGTLTCTPTGAAAGRLRLSMTAVLTGALAEGNYKWDLKLKTASYDYFYAKGILTVDSTVSRDAS